MALKLPIKLVSKRVGLSPHVIRVWEKRYRAVTPERTEGKRRLYSEADILRLSLLAELTNAGHRIGDIANLPTQRLQSIVAKELPARVPPPPRNARLSSEAQLLEDSVQAIAALDRIRLEEVLTKAAIMFGAHGMLQKLIAPLTTRIGELWRDGTLTAAHEHFASAVIRVFVGTTNRPFAPSSSVPNIVIATPSGQLHELGAVIVAAAATDLGWHVTYLGVGLPPAEISAAAVQSEARVVALSLVYPEDDANLHQELETLRRYLPSQIKILVGGRATPAYRDTLNKIGAVQPASLDEFYHELDRIRSNGQPPRNGKHQP